jgi:hypothetical protein
MGMIMPRGAGRAGLLSLGFVSAKPNLTTFPFLMIREDEKPGK